MWPVRWLIGSIRAQKNQPVCCLYTRCAVGSLCSYIVVCKICNLSCRPEELVRFSCVFTLIAFTCNTWFSNSALSRRSSRGRFRRLRISQEFRMWESKGFVMNSSYRTNHRQVKEKPESLGTGAVLSEDGGRGTGVVLSEDRGRGCSRIGASIPGSQASWSCKLQVQEGTVSQNKMEREKNRSGSGFCIFTHTWAHLHSPHTRGGEGGACEQKGALCE